MSGILEGDCDYFGVSDKNPRGGIKSYIAFCGRGGIKRVIIASREQERQVTMIVHAHHQAGKHHQSVKFQTKSL